MKATGDQRRALGGLVVRKEAWRLSWLGWAAIHELYPFLAITRPVPSRTLVIDGWLPTFDLEQAARMFQTGDYQNVLVVNAYYEYQWIDQDPGNTATTRAVLVHAGVPSGRIYPVLFPGGRVDRTYSGAVAVRQWFAKMRQPLSSLDLITLGTHARRSRLLYELAMGPRVRLGVIALKDPGYDTRHWWRFSEGIREVPFEGLAYLYVRLFFDPPAP